MKLISIMLCTLAACAFSVDSDGSSPPPTVLSSVPSDGATGVALDGTVRATFSEAMDPPSVNEATFTLTSGDLVIAGSVLYADSTAVFRPSVDLQRGVTYTATISTGANSDAGVALAAEYAWTFTGDQFGGPGGAPVNLRTAGTYAVLAVDSIVGTGAIVTGNLGISPAVASSITGFALMADLSTQFSTSLQVIGRVYAADYGAPTPTILSVAASDLRLAYAEAAGRTPTAPSEMGAGNIGGMALAPGVYRWSTGVSIPADITLIGGASDVWIFQITGTLNLEASRVVTLTGGALSKNVFWQVTGAVTLGAMARLEGIVLGAAAFTSGAGTTIHGRVLSQTAVTITGSSVVRPAP